MVKRVVNLVFKTSNSISGMVIAVTARKGALNTKFSTGCGFNRPEEQGQRQTVGVSGITFTLKTWL